MPCLAFRDGEHVCQVIASNFNVARRDNSGLDARSWGLKKNAGLCHGLPHPKRHTKEEWGHLS